MRIVKRRVLWNDCNYVIRQISKWVSMCNFELFTQPSKTSLALSLSLFFTLKCFYPKFNLFLLTLTSKSSSASPLIWPICFSTRQTILSVQSFIRYCVQESSINDVTHFLIFLSPILLVAFFNANLTKLLDPPLPIDKKKL